MEENEEDGQDQIEYLDAGMFHLQSCALLVWMMSFLRFRILKKALSEAHDCTLGGFHFQLVVLF